MHYPSIIDLPITIDLAKNAAMSVDCIATVHVLSASQYELEWELENVLPLNSRGQVGAWPAYFSEAVLEGIEMVALEVLHDMDSDIFVEVERLDCIDHSAAHPHKLTKSELI